MPPFDQHRRCGSPHHVADRGHASVAAQRLKVGADHAFSLNGEICQIDVVGQRHAVSVYRKNGRPLRLVGAGELNQEVEPSRTQQCSVDLVEPVGGGDHGNAPQILNAVEFGQKLGDHPVGNLATLATPVGSQGIDFIEEDDTGRGLARLAEYFAHSPFRLSYPHAEKLRSLDRDEIGAALAGKGLGQQRFSGTGNAIEQDALRRMNPGLPEQIGMTNRPLDRLDQKPFALGNLAGGIAHDLRNMLFPILSLTGLTIKELPEGNQRKRLERVLQATERAKGLVEKIHAFSHEEKPSREAVEVSSLLAEAMGLIRPALPSTITVIETCDCSPGAKVAVDCGQFDTILMNLASNAADAMAEKPGTLTFACSEVDVDKDLAVSILVAAEGAHLKLVVTDTGPGMEEKIRRRVFDPWFSTKPKGEGTGLGLAVVRKVVAEHGGAITVASTPGQGTTFEVFLPLI